MARDDPNFLTQAAYARSRQERGLPGGSREAVRKAVDEGRITVFGDKRKVHRELADLEWERNTRARQSPQAAALGTSDLPLVTVDSVPAAPAAGPAAPPPPDGYTAARARREAAEAAIAEFQQKKLSGEMVMTADVSRGAFEAGQALRDAFDASVNPLAAELAPLATADECAAVLRRHNRAILELLVKAFREKLGKSAGAIS